MSFWEDFKGSFGRGQFYKDILGRPIAKAWAYFFMLVAILAVMLAISDTIKFARLYGEIASFMQESMPSISMDKGKITNMPTSRIGKEYPNWSLRMDTIYVDSISALADSINIPSSHACLSVGPKKAFLVKEKKAITFEYPSSINKTITADELRKAKSFLYPLSFVGIAIVNAIMSAISGLFFALVIAMITAFKYRSIRISFGQSIQVSLYLVTIQMLVSTLFGLLQISIPYIFLWYILFYIIYVGLFVNVNLVSAPQPEQISNSPWQN